MRKLIFVSLFVLILQFGAVAQSLEFDLGIKLAKSGAFETALPHFQKAVDNNLSTKKLAQVYYNIGVCYYQLKQADAAVLEFKKAIKLYPNYEKAFYALGMANTDLKHLDEAETAFRQSLKLSNNGETWFDLALILFELKKFDEAAESFNNAIKFGSEATAASHNNLGVVLAMKGDFKLAEKELKFAEKLNFLEATNNLNIVRQAMLTNDRTLIAKLILKEKND